MMKYMENTFKKISVLFTTTFMVSATTNGGYAIAAALKNRFVDKYHWLSEEEMLDYMSLGQSVPGPIAISTSVLVGHGIAGIPGAVIAMLGTVCPPLIIMSIVSIFYNLIADNQIVSMFMKGMQAGVVALLVSILIDLFRNATKSKSSFHYGLILGALLIVRFTSVSVFYLVIGCGCLGILKMTLDAQKEGKHGTD